MTWTLIESQTLGSAAASVTFSSGLSAYKFFRLSGIIVSDATSKFLYVRFNGDSGANYTDQSIVASNTTVTGERHTGATQVEVTASAITLANGRGQLCLIAAKPSASTAGQVVGRTGLNEAASVAGVVNAGQWSNTADSVTSLSVVASVGQFATGTSFLLEGLAS